jgi:hypothetical protein
MPPANQPSVVLPVPLPRVVALLNDPRILAVTVSVANNIRCMLDVAAGALVSDPPPYQPAFTVEGGRVIDNPPPLNVIPAVIVTGIIYLSL